MTEVTPHPLKTQGFHHFFILLFYDHPAEAHFLVFSAPAPVSAVAFIISYCGYHHTLGSLKKVGTSPGLCWRSCVRSSAARPTMSYPSNSGSRHSSGRCFCAKAKNRLTPPNLVVYCGTVQITLYRCSIVRFVALLHIFFVLPLFLPIATLAFFDDNKLTAGRQNGKTGFRQVISEWQLSFHRLCSCCRLRCQPSSSLMMTSSICFGV